MAGYIARRRMLINGARYEPGEVVPEAEKLQKFRTLVSAGFFIKRKDVGPPPPTLPADLSPSTRVPETVEVLEVPEASAKPPSVAQEAVETTESSATETTEVTGPEVTETPEPSRVEEAQEDGVDVQWQPSKQPSGRSEVRDRRYTGSGPTSNRRGSTVRVDTIRK